MVQEGLRVVVVFEGRDAAGKGGVIKRITERVSPRVQPCKVLGQHANRLDRVRCSRIGDRQEPRVDDVRANNGER